MDKNYFKNELYTIEYIDKALELTKDFYNGDFRPRLLRLGNHKLPRNVMCWDLPCKVTCKYNCPNCYALKAEKQYKNRTILMRAYHYEIVKQALTNSKKREYLLKYMDGEIQEHIKRCSKKHQLPIMRIHSSGDIFSMEYLGLLVSIIKSHPEVNFYTYTKQLDNNLIDELNKIPNLNIVKSIIDVDGKSCINYGDMDYIYKIQERLEKSNKDCFICSYGILKNSAVCMQDCKACLYYSNVLFKQH